jgi:tellurite resistance protein TehA-like permease
MTSANLLIVLIVGTAVGALTGLGLSGYFNNQLYLAILAGFLGTIIGALARNFIMARRTGVGPDDSRTPLLVIVYAAIASLVSSAAALEIAQQSHLEDSPVWIGTLAGLFAAILMAMLMITYHTHPGEMPKLRSRH